MSAAVDTGQRARQDTPVGESRCTCGAWYAPPEARRRCAPGCPALQPAAAPVGDATGLDDLLLRLSRTPRDQLQDVLVAVDRATAVRAALALLTSHQPSKAESPVGWSAPEALISNAILSLDSALHHLTAQGGPK